MKTNRHFKLVFLACALLIIGSGMLLKSGSKKKSRTPETVVGAEKSSVDRRDPKLKLSDSIPPAYQIRDSAVVAEEKAISKLSDADVAFDRKIALFEDIDQKVLKTTEERSSYDRMLSDASFLHDVLDHMSNATVESKRLHQVDYLCAALVEENRQGGQAVKLAVADFIASGDLDLISDKSVRQSLAADRIEIFSYLRRVDPVIAQNVIESNKSAVNAKIFKFVVANYK